MIVNLYRLVLIYCILRLLLDGPCLFDESVPEFTTLEDVSAQLLASRFPDPDSFVSVHSGCGISATMWFIYFTVQLTIDFTRNKASKDY